MKKIFTKLIKLILAILLTLFALPFLISPVYDFPEAKPFSGDKIWNPYQNIDSAKWLKGNFQIQSRAWGGVTDGSNNPTDSIYSRYERLGYDIIGISDYMKINKYFDDHPGYISIYEHGYNIRKTHQVNIGAKKVLWLDFPFYQTTSHKQFIINLLRKHSDIISLAHPAFSLNGYNHNDLKYLVNYDLIEALNHQKFSFSHWDAALSNGHPKYILANDDAHNIENPFLYGVIATMIHANSTSSKDIISALLAGKSYGFIPHTPGGETLEKKISRIKDFPYLQSAKLNGNRYTLKFYKNTPKTRTPKKIEFIGQNGKIKKTVTDIDSAYYDFQDDDTYIRVFIDFGQREKMYLNPIFRYNSDNPLSEQKAEINWIKSLLSWILSWITYLFLTYILFRRKTTKRLKN